MIMPLNGDATSGTGQQPFPCKGHHLHIDGPQGSPVATWQAGETVTCMELRHKGCMGRKACGKWSFSWRLEARFES